MTALDTRQRVGRGKRSQEFRFLGAAGWLDRLRGHRVLDLGCGGGLYLEALRDREARPVGVDLGIGTLRLAQAYLADPPVPLVCGTGPTLPFADAAFEAVVCIEVLTHVPPVQQALVVREIHRVLAPGGQLIISVHNRPRLALQRLVRLQRPTPEYRNPGMTVYPLSRAQLLRQLGARGFRAVDGPVYANLYNSAHQRYAGLGLYLRMVEDLGRHVPGVGALYLTALGRFARTDKEDG